jgi:hypothetical protein
MRTLQGFDFDLPISAPRPSNRVRVCPPVSSDTPATTICTFSPVVVIIDGLGWQVPTGAICSCKSSKKFASATCLWWVGYVVMPDHIHLLISEPERGTPSTVMQVVKQRFARRVLNGKRRNPRQAVPCPNLRSMFGRSDFTISTCGASASAWKSCAICIAIR